MSKLTMVLVTAFVLILVIALPGIAQEGEANESARSPLAVGLIAVASALAIGLSALATAWAQSRIGSAGAGTIAERPDSAGTIIVLVAIPETMVILGFVVSIVMLFTL